VEVATVRAVSVAAVAAPQYPELGEPMIARLIRPLDQDLPVAVHIADTLVALVRLNRRSRHGATAVLFHRSLPMDLNLLTAKAPRSFRAFDPGAVNGDSTAARSASRISTASKFSSKSTIRTASQSLSSRMDPSLWLRLPLSRTHLPLICNRRTGVVV
jgi:hypothetical protein